MCSVYISDIIWYIIPHIYLLALCNFNWLKYVRIKNAKTIIRLCKKGNIKKCCYWVWIWHSSTLLNEIWLMVCTMYLVKYVLKHTIFRQGAHIYNLMKQIKEPGKIKIQYLLTIRSLYREREYNAHRK